MSLAPERAGTSPNPTSRTRSNRRVGGATARDSGHIRRSTGTHQWAWLPASKHRTPGRSAPSQAQSRRDLRRGACRIPFSRKKNGNISRIASAELICATSCSTLSIIAVYALSGEQSDLGFLGFGVPLARRRVADCRDSPGSSAISSSALDKNTTLSSGSPSPIGTRSPSPRSFVDSWASRNTGFVAVGRF